MTQFEGVNLVHMHFIVIKPVFCDYWKNFRLYCNWNPKKIDTPTPFVGKLIAPMVQLRFHPIKKSYLIHLCVSVSDPYQYR